MNNIQPIDPIMNHLSDRFLKKCSQYRYTILSALLTGLLCYLFFFTNKLLNHDELQALFGASDSLSFGRWGIRFVSGLLGRCSMPWFLGVITLTAMTGACCLIVRIFSIRTRLLQMLVPAMIISFPALTGNFSYMFLSGCYGIAFLLSVLSVCFIIQKKPTYWAVAVVCLVFSASIYQAYVAVAASLLIIHLIQNTMYSDCSVKEIFLEGLRFLVFLAVSMMLYALITWLLLRVRGISMGSYATTAMNGQMGPVEKIKEILFFIFFVLFSNMRKVVPTPFSSLLHLVCIVSIGLEMLFWVCHKKNLSRLPMLVLLLVLLPFAICALLLVSSLDAVHTLVIYSFATVYILFAVVIEGGCTLSAARELLNRLRRILMDAALVSMCLIVFCNAAVANEAALNMHISYEQNYSFATSLIAQLQMTQGYEEGMPVAIIGNFPRQKRMDGFSDLEGLTGTAGFGTDAWSYDYFYRFYLGFDIELADPETCEQIRKTDEFAEMNSYPNAGFIRIIDSIAVVRLD